MAYSEPPNPVETLKCFLNGSHITISGGVSWDDPAPISAEVSYYRELPTPAKGGWVSMPINNTNIPWTKNLDQLLKIVQDEINGESV